MLLRLSQRYLLHRRIPSVTSVLSAGRHQVLFRREDEKPEYPGAHIISQRRNYTPLAYRKQTLEDEAHPRRGKGHRRPRGKKVADEAPKEKTPRVSSKRLRELEEEGARYMISYHQTLFDVTLVIPDNMMKDTSGLIQALDSLHERCAPSDVSLGMEVLHKSEEDFRKLCKLLDTLVFSLCQSENFPSKSDGGPSIVAKRLLWAFIQARSDRSKLIDAAFISSQVDSSEKSEGWTSWFRDVFIEAPGEDEGKADAEAEADYLKAHRDAEWAPSSRSFLAVIKGIFIANKIPGIGFYSTEDETEETHARIRAQRRKALVELSDRANSASALIDAMSQHRFVPGKYALSSAIKMHESVGLLANAMEAERLFSQYVDNDSPSLFLRVMTAYREASLLEPDASVRAEVARRAEQFVVDRQDTQFLQALNSNRQYAPYRLLLDIFLNVGTTALPDVCDRAELVVQRCIGPKVLANLSKSNADGISVSSDHFFPLLHRLVTFYVNEGGEDNFHRAVNIVRNMEKARSTRKMGRGHKTNQGGRPMDAHFPNVTTYNTVMRGIVQRMHKDPSSSADLESLALDMMNDMTLHPSSWPNEVTFKRLLTIIGGRHEPEEILSRMEVRKAFLADRINKMDIQHAYRFALLSLKLAAQDGQPDTARRAQWHLSKMETQSGVSGVSLSALENYSDMEKDVMESVYNSHLQPSLDDYNLVIKICSKVQVPSEMESALDIAFQVYENMKARQISPKPKTIEDLLWCCINLLPKDPVRRKEKAGMVLKFAKDQDVVISSGIEKALAEVGLEDY